MAFEKIGFGIKVYPPDLSLRMKLGDISLDEAFTPEVVAEAQNTVGNMSGAFFSEVLDQAEELGKIDAAINVSTNLEKEQLSRLISLSFSIKSKSGMVGYGLVSTLAKSLQLLAESIQGHNISVKQAELVHWHINSIRVLLRERLEGRGGATGEKIIAQLQFLHPEEKI
jgi:hypothetical protein